MTEVILIILVSSLVGVSLMYVIKQLSDYYATKYHFSLWAGVLLMAISLVALGLTESATEDITVHFLRIIAVGCILYTLCQDVRLFSVGMGLAAFTLQILLTASFFVIILAIITRWFMNAVLGKRSRLTINPGIAVGFNFGDPFRYFFTLSIHKNS